MLEHPSISDLPPAIPTWSRSDFLFTPASFESDGVAAEDSKGSGTKVFNEKERFLETVTDVTQVLFKRAMEQNDVWLAFVQVQESQKYSLSHYPEMRSGLIGHIEALLDKSDVELAADYRAFLNGVKKELSEATFAGRFVWAPGGSKPRRAPREQDPEYQRTLKEITPDLFEAMIKDREVGWAYKHLKRACALGLEGYPTMREQFLALLNSELAKSDEQVGGEYRRRLEEWRQCLKVECWTQKTVVQ